MKSESPSEQQLALKKIKPCGGDEYNSLVRQLADQTNVACHPNSALTIKSVRLVLERAIGARQNPSLSGFQVDDIKLPTGECRLETSQQQQQQQSDDYCNAVDELLALKLHKLLYLSDLKNLQRQVNATIANIQPLTANPIQASSQKPRRRF